MTKRMTSPKSKGTKAAKTVKKGAKAPADAAKPNAIVEAARRAKAVRAEARERTLRSLLALIERRKARIVEDFYDIGEALRTILRERLFEARDKTFEDLLESEIGISAASAFRLIAVVDALPRDKALELGQEKSYALVAYAAATPESDSPLALAQTPLARLGANEIKRAASALRTKKRSERAPATHQALAKKAVAALRALGLAKPTATLRGRTITLRAELPDSA